VRPLCFVLIFFMIFMFCSLPSLSYWWWDKDIQTVLGVLRDKNLKAEMEARQLVGIYEGPKSDRCQALQLTWKLLTGQSCSVPGF